MVRISSITKGPRQSNFELLRIVAMFMVLSFHANFWTLGEPSISETRESPIPTFTRDFFEALCYGCVNVFILISGWFGIKFSFKGLANFLFQSIFIISTVYAFAIAVGYIPFSFTVILDCLYITPDIGWFVKTYLGLYIISPALNACAEKLSKKNFEILLISFFTFQTVYGLFLGSAKFILNGYSVFSFIGLYLLSRYLNIYKPSSYQYGIGFIILTIFATAIYFLSFYLGVPRIGYWIFSYISPIIILSSLMLLLYFKNLKLGHNKFINWVSASSFAVFLIHCCAIPARDFFKDTIKYLYDDFHGITCLLFIFLFLMMIFIVAILIDQIRIFIWEKIFNSIYFRPSVT